MIETERLILRRFNENDLNDVYEYLTKALPHCFFDMKVTSINEIKDKLIERIEDEFYFAITLKDSNKVIGELFGHLEDDKETFSICWLLNSKYGGKGYAYEGAKAYLSYLFKIKNIRRIYAFTEIDNFHSQKLCERLGMRKEGTFIDFISFVKDETGKKVCKTTLEYAILKKEWSE